MLQQRLLASHKFCDALVLSCLSHILVSVLIHLQHPRETCLRRSGQITRRVRLQIDRNVDNGCGEQRVKNGEHQRLNITLMGLKTIIDVDRYNTHICIHIYIYTYTIICIHVSVYISIQIPLCFFEVPDLIGPVGRQIDPRRKYIPYIWPPNWSCPGSFYRTPSARQPVDGIAKT